MKNKIETSLRNKLADMEKTMISEQEFPVVYMLNSMHEVMGGVLLSIDEDLKHKFASDFITLLNVYREVA